MTCELCEGYGWVCENHPNLPFDHGDGCGGAGDPCPICNPKADTDNIFDVIIAQIEE